jgi:hypothetical protein
VILEADVPRVGCSEHGCRQAQAPWAEPSCGFTALVEAVVIDGLRSLAIFNASSWLRVAFAIAIDSETLTVPLMGPRSLVIVDLVSHAIA